MNLEETNVRGMKQLARWLKPDNNVIIKIDLKGVFVIIDVVLQ